MKQLICVILICLMFVFVPVSAADGPVMTERIEAAMQEAYSNSYDFEQDPIM